MGRESRAAEPTPARLAHLAGESLEPFRSGEISSRPGRGAPPPRTPCASPGESLHPTPVSQPSTATVRAPHGGPGPDEKGRGARGQAGQPTHTWRPALPCPALPQAGTSTAPCGHQSGLDSPDHHPMTVEAPQHKTHQGPHHSSQKPGLLSPTPATPGMPGPPGQGGIGQSGSILTNSACFQGSFLTFRSPPDPEHPGQCRQKGTGLSREGAAGVGAPAGTLFPGGRRTDPRRARIYPRPKSSRHSRAQPHRRSGRGARGGGQPAERGRAHLGHVDGARRQRLVAQDGPVFVPLSPLQHNLELVAFSFQEMRVLQRREVTAALCASRHSSLGHRGPQSGTR